MDILVVGAGLSGLTFAYLAKQAGHDVRIIESRNHIGGNCYDKDGIHQYGVHIFHTKNEWAWKFVNKFTTFKPYHFTALNNYNGVLFSSPLSMYTFSRLLNIQSPFEAKKYVDYMQYKYRHFKDRNNAKDVIISQVGEFLYEYCYQPYLTKHWGVDPSKLDTSIVQRIPIRYTYNTQYFDHTYQALPNSYEEMFLNMSTNIPIEYETKYDKKNHRADVVIYTGTIDSYFDYRYGSLEYRTLDFEVKENTEDNGAAMVRFSQGGYYRAIDYRYVTGKQKTIYETARTYKEGDVPMYPLLTEENKKRYQAYKEHATKNVFFLGRLATYKYIDMDQSILSAKKLADRLF